jgi:hypothetical protein
MTESVEGLRCASPVKQVAETCRPLALPVVQPNSTLVTATASASGTNGDATTCTKRRLWLGNKLPCTLVHPTPPFHCTACSLMMMPLFRRFLILVSARVCFDAVSFLVTCFITCAVTMCIRHDFLPRNTSLHMIAVNFPAVPHLPVMLVQLKQPISCQHRLFWIGTSQFVIGPMPFE